MGRDRPASGSDEPVDARLKIFQVLWQVSPNCAYDGLPAMVFA
jgi:hypothetical protein